jgi:putative membrane protein
MVHHVISFLAFTVAVLGAARVVPGIKVKSFGSAMLFALVFALLNKLLFLPIALLTFPLLLLTLGLGIILINAFIFWLADKVVSGVEVRSFGSALIGSLVATVINWAIMAVLHVVF